ncbi:MAG: DUF1801 domain-containing protein [Pseudomonadota bacterium]
MADNKTAMTDASPEAFIAAVGHPTRRADAEVLHAMFTRVTGWRARMWGPSLIGYGSYHYRYASGREGDMLATGFSPRKASQSIYVMPGYQDYGGLLARLGKHKTGAACLYVTKLADIDMDVLEELVRTGLEDLQQKYPVTPS